MRNEEADRLTQLVERSKCEKCGGALIRYKGQAWRHEYNDARCLTQPDWDKTPGSAPYANGSTVSEAEHMEAWGN